MDIEQFKAQHPALYQQVFSSGREAGVLAERDRIEALLVYAEFDPKLEKIQACIAGGRDFSKKELAEFRVASFNSQALRDLESDSEDANASGSPGNENAPNIPGVSGLSADAGEIQNKWQNRENQANKHRGGEQ